MRASPASFTAPRWAAGPRWTLYCIDINTDTYIGNGYALGTWNVANVPHVGYVARILDEYYPNTNEPSSLGRYIDQGGRRSGCRLVLQRPVRAQHLRTDR